MDIREIKAEADEECVIEKRALSDLSNLQDGTMVPVRVNAADRQAFKKAISHDVASAGT